MFRRIRKRCGVLLIVCIMFSTGAQAYEATTLRHGSRGEEVAALQQALISLGYLKGNADGIYGNRTENAVRSFQKKNRLTADGLAGAKTRALIQSLLAGAAASPIRDNAGQVAAEPSASDTGKSAEPSAPSASSAWFSGSYAAIRSGQTGSRVRLLQRALISLKYLKGSADGKFGPATLAAVKAYQKAAGLSVDGVAGKKTLAALEKSMADGSASSQEEAAGKAASEAFPASASEDQPVQESGNLNPLMSLPDASSLRLMSWFDEVKPALSSGQHLLILDPASGLNWTLRVYARGRHCDAEPLTAKDTATMVAAFGGINTWNQKAVYVRLPDGRWTVGSTHDMPHDSGSIKDNGFSGHLCVHFLRTMEEAKQNDPNYGVSNQKTIRAFWTKLTGENIAE